MMDIGVANSKVTSKFISIRIAGLPLKLSVTMKSGNEEESTPNKVRKFFPYTLFIL